MKLKSKLQSIKNKLFMQRFAVYAGVMCFLMAAVILSVTKITEDIENVNGPIQNRVIVATDGAITNEVTTTVTPSVTVTPTATTTPTPTPDPRTQVTVSLNYKTEKMTISSTLSSKIYISQDKQKTWELVERPHSIDLAIFMKNSDNYIYIKGDKDEKVVEVKIPKADNSLKVSYKVEKDEGKLVFTNVLGNLQYRKGSEGEWQLYNYSMKLADYEINGYTLQFRAMATENTRAGKIVSVKIPKRQSPPTIKVDYSKFTLTGMKAGVTQYRLAGSDKWIDFKPVDSKVKTLDLTALLLPGIAPNVAPIPAGNIEFRNLGNEKKVASGVRVIQTLAQPVAPLASNVKLNTNRLVFVDASKDKPYEYMVLHKGEAVNLQTAKWKKVTSSKEIVITKVGTASPVPGDIIYYRLASTKDAKTKEIIPASMYASIEITSVILLK